MFVFSFNSHKILIHVVFNMLINTVWRWRSLWHCYQTLLTTIDNQVEWMISISISEDSVPIFHLRPPMEFSFRRIHKMTWLASQKKVYFESLTQTINPSNRKCIKSSFTWSIHVSYLNLTIWSLPLANVFYMILKADQVQWPPTWYPLTTVLLHLYLKPNIAFTE